MKPKSGTDFSRSLQALEKADWGEPTYDSYVVRTVHTLRRKPLSNLTNEELRLAISQEVGFPFVLDLTFERLRADPLICGDFYLGDVLVNLMRAPPTIWHGRPALQAELPALVSEATRRSHEHDFEGETFRKELTRLEADATQH